MLSASEIQDLQRRTAEAHPNGSEEAAEKAWHAAMSLTPPEGAATLVDLDRACVLANEAMALERGTWEKFTHELVGYCAAVRLVLVATSPPKT